MSLSPQSLKKHKSTEPPKSAFVLYVMTETDVCTFEGRQTARSQSRHALSPPFFSASAYAATIARTSEGPLRYRRLEASSAPRPPSEVRNASGKEPRKA